MTFVVDASGPLVVTSCVDLVISHDFAISPVSTRPQNVVNSRMYL
jgi:hypothetical protein